jgi:membrane-associated HD superfamily phosphohydrolase
MGVIMSKRRRKKRVRRSANTTTDVVVKNDERKTVFGMFILVLAFGSAIAFHSFKNSSVASASSYLPLYTATNNVAQDWQDTSYQQDTQDSYQTSTNESSALQQRYDIFAEEMDRVRYETDALRESQKKLSSKLSLLGAAHNNNTQILRKWDGNAIAITKDWKLDKFPRHLTLTEEDKIRLGSHVRQNNGVQVQNHQGHSHQSFRQGVRRCN